MALGIDYLSHPLFFERLFVISFRPIFVINGLLLLILAVTMLIPACVDLYTGSSDWIVFVVSAAITASVGGALYLAAHGEKLRIAVRTGFLLTTSCWVFLSVFAAIPFVLSELQLSFVDAFFESVSGITTTGSTVIRGLDDLPAGILLWRSLLQWMGGVGIIVVALAVMPMLQIGGMQLFRTESSDNSEKVLPRLTEIASSIGMVYVFLTAACSLAFFLAGMNWFDAIAHAMTTVATGGFSTHDASLGYFDSATIEMITVVFMLGSALPFVLYLKMLQGKSGALFKDSQVRWFLTIVFFSVTAVLANLIFLHDQDPEYAARHAIFNVVSVITGTGYASADYGGWGAFAVGLIFFLMFVGGCAGSTTCGIKVFRLQVLYATCKVQLNRLLHPNGVFISYYNGKRMPDDVPAAVLSFFFLYAICFAVLALSLKVFNLDFVTAFSGAATAISNVGPGLGDIIGPAGTFTDLQDGAKWILAIGMLLGRLELFTVLVLFVPAFWRR